MSNRSFDLVAPFYVLLEWLSFGDQLNVARNAFITTVLSAKHSLLIGEGNGRFLADCLENKAGGSITILDSSPKMLEHLARRIRTIHHRTELRMVCADILEWQSGKSPSIDVIVTHFFLDLFRPVTQQKVIEKITLFAKPGATWINVDYHPANKKGAVRLIDWLQYRFDALLCGIETDRHYDPSALLTESGWIAQEERLFLNGAVVAQFLVRASTPFNVEGQSSSSPRESSVCATRGTTLSPTLSG